MSSRTNATATALDSDPDAVVPSKRRQTPAPAPSAVCGYHPGRPCSCNPTHFPPVTRQQFDQLAEAFDSLTRARDGHPGLDPTGDICSCPFCQDVEALRVLAGHTLNRWGRHFGAGPDVDPYRP